MSKIDTWKEDLNKEIKEGLSVWLEWYNQAELPIEEIQTIVITATAEYFEQAYKDNIECEETGISDLIEKARKKLKNEISESYHRDIDAVMDELTEDI